MIQIQGVPSARAAEVWPIVRAWIGAALERGHSLESTDDVLAKIQAQEYQLWAVDQGGPVAAFVTRIASGSLGSALVTVALGGRGMEHWLPAVEDVIARFARDKGCTRIYLSGRRGWAKQLQQFGWKEDTVNVMKEL